MKIILTEDTKWWKANTLADLDKGILTLEGSKLGFLLTPQDKVAYKVYKCPKTKTEIAIVIMNLTSEYSLSDLAKKTKEQLFEILKELQK